MQCEKLEKCPFFNDKMANMPAVAGMLKKQYCQNDKESCARYIVSKAGKDVPMDLFPQQKERIAAIIG